MACIQMCYEVGGIAARYQLVALFICNHPHKELRVNDAAARLSCGGRMHHLS